MKKRKKLYVALAAPLAFVAALAFGTSSAIAQTAAVTYTITAGSAGSGTSVPFTADTTGTVPQVQFSDVPAGLNMTCDSSTASGDTTTGSGLSAIGLAHITNIAWTNCEGLGVALNVTASGLPWNVDGTGPTAGGRTPGEIEPVSAHIEDTSGGALCSFDVTGSAGGYYDNTDHTLHLDGSGTLQIHNPAGLICGGSLIEGDAATYVATYAVTANDPGNDPIEINSESELQRLAVVGGAESPAHHGGH